MAEQVSWEKAELDASNSDVYRIEMTGDEVEWVARPGVNLKKVGVDPDTGEDVLEPQPWRDVARGIITIRARSEKEAEVWAIRRHPEYHTVESILLVEKRKK
jgi:hypothetical protein